MFRQARFKLALSYAGVLALTVFVIGVAAYFAVRRSMDSDINGSIERAASGLLGTDFRHLGAPPNNGGPNNGGPRFPRLTDEEQAATVETDIFYLVSDDDGHIVSNPRQINLAGLDLESLAKNAEGQASTEDVNAAGHHYRILTQSIGASGSAAYLYVGRSLDARDSQLQTLAFVLALGGLVGVALSGAGGWWLAGRALVPIQRALETQRRFVSDASHELRTPIAVVKANNELLLRHPEETVESSLDQVEAVAAEADHMGRLVEGLLTLARADEGQAALKPEAIDLTALVEEIGRDMGALAELRGVNLNMATAQVRIDGDRQRIRQLVVILLDNALKYTPAGGCVTLRLERAGRQAEIVVSDTGPGIAPEHQRHIFDRFYRVDAARSRVDGGTGLGLAIASWIAEAHHGRLSLESTVGKGSTFMVRLPAKE
jgi:two-component system, OmpR family, sensor histidine kinase CiaH